MLVMERSCQWKGLHWPAPFSSDFPLTFLTETHPVTAETRIPLRDTDFNELLRAVVAPVPSARAVTALRWRAELGERHPGALVILPRGVNLFEVIKIFQGLQMRVHIPTVP